jgi:hypothetical protein
MEHPAPYKKIMLRNILKKIKLIVLPCQENDYRPKILTGNFVFYYLIALLILKLVVLPVIFFLPKSNLFADISRSILIDLTNEDRQEAGLTDLEENTLLNEAAYLKAKDILALDYFDHYSPEGKSPWYWFTQSGYNYWAAGENLGIGFLDSEEIYQAWYDSPDHRYNILNPNYQEIGIAILEGDFKGNKTQVVVQLFGSPKEKVAGLNTETGSTPEILEDNQVVEENPEEGEETEEETGEETIQTREEISKTIPNQGIVLGETYLEKFEPNPAQEETFYFKLLKFMIMGYDNFVQMITFYSLLFIAGFFIIVALIKFDFNHRALIFKACLFTSILIIFIFLNKDLILKIIPHNLGIY